MDAGQSITLQIRAVMQRAEADAKRALDWRGNTDGGGAASGGGGPGPSGGTGDAGGNGAPPASGGGPTGVPFIDGVIDNIARTFKIKGKFPPGKPGQFGVDLFSGALASDKFAGGYGKWELGAGTAGVGLRNVDGKWMLGAVAEVYGARAKIEGTVLGDQNFGLTSGIEAKALSATGFLGYRDGSVGGEVGVNLISAKGEVGTNVAGYNVGVNAEIGLKLELGLQIGKNTKVKLGPFTLGFSFGDAKK